MASKNEEKAGTSFDAKAMVDEHVEKGTKGQYFDRKKVVIVQATKHYREGQVINPHKLKAQALIDQKIAKEYKEKEA